MIERVAVAALTAGVLALAHVVGGAQPAQAAPLEPCAELFDVTPFANIFSPTPEFGYPCTPQFTIGSATIEFRSVGGDLPALDGADILTVSGGPDRTTFLQYLGAELDDIDLVDFDLPISLQTRLDDGSDPRRQQWLAAVSLEVDGFASSTGDGVPADLIETCAPPYPANVAAEWSFRPSTATLVLAGPEGPVEVQLELAPGPTQVLFALNPDSFDAESPDEVEGFVCVGAEGEVFRETLTDQTAGLGFLSAGLLTGAPFGFSADGTSPTLDPVTFVLGDETVAEEPPTPVDEAPAGTPAPVAAELPPTGAVSPFAFALGAVLALIVGVLAIASRRRVPQRASAGTVGR